MFSRSSSSSALPADQQSVVPTVRGLPWWGAVLLATVVTVIGAFIDSAPSGELGRTFKIIFIFGCVLAALAVRRRAVFTAAVQPPLVAFVVGLIVLYLEAGEAASDKKTLILKVVLPIATSFPWMLIALVLSIAIVLGRLFFTGPESKRPFGGVSGLVGKLTGKKPAATRKTSRATTPSRTTPSRTKAPPRTKKPSRTAPAAAGESAQGRAPRPARKASGPRPDSSAKDSATRRQSAPSTPSRRPRPKPAGSSTATDAPKQPAAKPARAAATKPAAPRPEPTARPAPTADTKQTRRPRRPAPADQPAEKKPKTQRAQPQKIPARQRRTAGQQLRERGQIEDLTAGLDD